MKQLISVLFFALLFLCSYGQNNPAPSSSSSAIDGSQKNGTLSTEIASDSVKVSSLNADLNAPNSTGVQNPVNTQPADTRKTPSGTDASIPK